MAAKKRFDAIQTLRFLCFLIVFADHAGFYKVSGVANFGELCIMSVFLIMSGFLMVYSYMDREVPNDLKSSFRFSTGKISKLYPLHWKTALIQFAIIVWLYWDLFKAIDQIHAESILFRFGVNLSLMQAWVPDFPNYVFNFNGPSWFLSVMLFAYFVFPLFLKLLKKLDSVKKLNLLAGGLVALSLCAAIIFGTLTGFDDTYFVWFTQNFPLMRAVDFLLGAIIGYMYVKRRREASVDVDAKEHNKGLWTFIEAVVILLFYVGSYFAAAALILNCGNIGKAIVFCAPLFSCLFAIPMTMVFIWNRGYITKALSWKPLVYLGNISMYTYLIHYVFTQFWASFCQKTGYDDSGIVHWIAIVVELGLTILVSVLYDKHQKKKAAKAKALKEAAAAKA